MSVTAENMEYAVSASMYPRSLYATGSMQSSEVENPETLPSQSFKAKDPFDKLPATAPAVKRTVSSPVIRSSNTDIDGSSTSAADNKKRNKLGYHRTAVACGEGASTHLSEFVRTDLS